MHDSNIVSLPYLPYRRQTEPQVDAVETDEQTRGLKEKIKCREEHMACRVVPKCCGELVCYWPDGFSLRNVSSSGHSNYHCLLNG